MNALPDPSTLPALLGMRGVCKRFDNVVALADVALEVHRGEVHAICGENGAGKSTLMKVLSGVHAPDEGELRIDGEPVRIDGLPHAQRLGIVMIHQELNLVPHLTVAENIWLGREPRRGWFVDRERQREGARACLARLGADIDPDALVTTLPIAQRQLVEIAKALSLQARLLIMDEPTSSLGEADAARLLQVVRELRRDGVGILYISHRLDELEAIADRVTVLRDGRYIATRRWHETSIDEIVSLMVGRELDQQFPPATRRPVDEVLLRVRGLRRHGVFGPLDFELRRGEILGFAGLVGAGRTELLEGVLGLRTAHGEVRRDGRPVRFATVRDSMSAGIVYLSEDRKGKGLLLAQDLRINLTLAALKRFTRGPVIDTGKEWAELDRAIAAFDVRTRRKDLLAGQLSGGNQQKLLLGKMMLLEPEIVVIDEPTRGIDIGTKQQIYRFVAELAAQGKSVIVISSEMQELIGLCHRILVMRSGRIVGEVTGHAMTEDEIVTYATGVKTMALAGEA